MSDESETLNTQALAAFECPVCLETCFPPIYLCKNGHTVCKRCQPKLTECATCRQPGQPLERSIQLDRIAALLKVQCNPGCRLTFSINDIEKHQATCDHRFKCRICADCIGTAQKVKEHVIQEHPLSFYELSKNDRRIDRFTLPEVMHSFITRSFVLFTFNGDVFWTRIQYQSTTSIFSHTVSVLKHDSLGAEQYVFSSELISRDKNIKYRSVHESTVLIAGEADNREMEVFMPARIVRACRKGRVDVIFTISLIGGVTKEGLLPEEAGPPQTKRVCRDRSQP